MITTFAGGVITAAVLASAFVSGIFGMVGGQILLAVLLYYLSVPVAMTVFSGMMFVNGAWRGFFWRQHIHWPITLQYFAGAIAGYAMMMTIHFVPSKPVIYLGLGLLPLAGDLVPKRFAPDISRRGLPTLAGFLTTSLQIGVGAAGNVLDMFFQASPLNRHTIVATKAVTQLMSQVMRFAYFGALVADIRDIAPWWFFVILIGMSFAGTSGGGYVLNRLSDLHFRKGTRYLIWFLSLIYVGRGLWLLVTGWTT